MGQRAERLARDRVDDVVRGSAAEHRNHVSPRLGETDARRVGGGLPGRGRGAARVDLCGALAPDGPDRGGAEVIRRRAGRPRRDLHADVSGSGDRIACLRPHRRRPGADLLRLRRAGDCPAAAGLRREGRDHCRLLASPRDANPHALDGRRGTSRRAFGRARADVETRVDGVGRRARPRPAARARGRGGASLPARLHLRHDRAA